jgi:hypothetical protein
MLFNLERDPQELHDVSSDPANQEILEDLKWRLEDFREKQLELSRLGGLALSSPDPETKDALRKHGYLVD